ncbi:YcgN family cysteine cluster protein [Paracoccus sp. 1_MG-2023]|uniref:YcgN family cysteine cluster protein n=1 Tax=unclassified Paracoccus (in: a-proteobacteria) TaxID=2688777 RepID=UPI001C08FFBC|nr:MULTISPECIES: YcgN family cysteine cluster protein [unclassified Paracoccus (in: a-proteobacteria)]MBU2956745.1 YcgN family cysteine cluster protein [Paracoccus sp. C2R09]MDO6669216.1 YcgN family cysteine cluster protein [Paracoccus sp. 1_MG-2023]
MRPNFWELPLKDLTRPEWEALCDGCGKCCLNKIEFEDTDELAFTRVACKLLDGQTCQCSSYPNRHDFVPDCVVLTPAKLDEISWWLPGTCAYRLRAEGKPLHDWHHLISGDREAVHRAGESVRGWTVNELSVDEDDWEDHIIEDLT